MNTKTLALCLGVVSAALFAAEKETAEIPTIIVEASRIDSSAAEIPANVQVITREEIDSSGANSALELLNKHTPVFVRMLNSNPLLGQVSMRGYGENSFGRVLIKVNGESLNNVDMEPALLSRIPLSAVERVEIIHGPQSVLNGDNASSGVINFVTDENSYDKKTKVFVRGGSWETIGTGATTRGGDEETGILYNAAFDYLKSDGYRANSGFEIWNLNGALNRIWDNGTKVGLSVFYNDSFYELPGSLSEAQYKSCHSPRMTGYDYEKSHAKSYSYGLALDSKFRLAEDQFLLLDGAFSSRNRDTIWDYDAGYGPTLNHYSYDSYTYQLSPRYVNEKEIACFENVFTLGSDFRLDTYKTLTDSYYYPPKRTFNRFMMGYFVRDEFFLTEELSLFAGARWERISSRSHDSSLDWTNDNRNLAAYEIGLNYRPNDDMKYFVKGSRFYRAPFCDEMNYTKPGSRLTPETGYSLDAGVDWTIAEEWSISFAAFHTITDKEIFYNPYSVWGDYGWEQYNENSPATTERNGFELFGGWSREKVGSLSAFYNYTDARFSGGVYKDKFVPMIPRQTLGMRGEVYLVDSFAINGGYRFVGEQRFGSDFTNEHGSLPCYSLFDAGFRFEPWGCLEGFKLSFTIDNLFNRKYCDYAGYGDWSGRYYYPGSGRCYMLTLSYEF